MTARSARIDDAIQPTRRRRPRRMAALAAPLMIAAGLVQPVLDAPPAAADEATTFDRPGTYTYTVPAGADQLTVDALGGTGGNPLVDTNAGGLGGRVQAVVPVTPGDVLTVIVGGAGTSSLDSSYYYYGYGGGPGDGWGGDSGAGYGHQAGGGASTLKSMYGDRLVVAGGGGGPGLSFTGPSGACGGHGGTPNGGDGCPGTDELYSGGLSNGGKGGTTTAGGAGGCDKLWSTAIGPDGGDSSYYWGGGGGGYYGGGGSCTDFYSDSDTYRGGGGGGGSSYATPDAIGAPLYSVGTSAGTLSLGHGYVTLIPGNPPDPGDLDPVELNPDFGQPSRDCDDLGGQQVVDTTTQGVAVYVYTLQVATEEVHVCWRADHDGDGVGGKLVVRTEAPTPGSVGAPSTDGDSDACTDTTSPPNQVPGSHPVTSGGVAGVPYSFDAYTDGATTAWACVEVGSVATRVKVPLSVSGPSGDPVVEWYPDEGTA